LITSRLRGRELRFLPEPFAAVARPISRVVICFLGLPEMTVSRTRQSLIGAIWAAPIFAPAICGAQPAGETGPKGDSNLTRQTQNEIDIALPSLAPLVERVMPAVVNISVELKEQAAAQGDENRAPRHSSRAARLSIKFLKRFFEQPFDPAIRRKKSWRSAPGSSSTPLAT
jgi:S1-C subfamily serine protease